MPEEQYGQSTLLLQPLQLDEPQLQPPVRPARRNDRTARYTATATISRTKMLGKFMAPSPDYPIKIPATRYASQAITQATAHWNSTMMHAHLPPSSRLTAAMAATHGV